MDKVKQVIIVRNDLKMPKGKLAAQVAHASLGALIKDKNISTDELKLPMTPELYAWLTGSFFKVVLKVEDETSLTEIFVKAKLKNLPVIKIVDAGHTFFKEPTATCVGIGPAKASIIDQITGDLKLL